jgi:hypothetical protein
MTKMMKVTNPIGITFNVRFVMIGDNYGRNDCLVNEKKILVEFYDSRYNDLSFGDRGQFVSRYYLSIIMECQTGINLEYGITDWHVSGDNVFDIQNFVGSNLL